MPGQRNVSIVGLFLTLFTKNLLQHELQRPWPQMRCVRSCEAAQPPHTVALRGLATMGESFALFPKIDGSHEPAAAAISSFCAATTETGSAGIAGALGMLAGGAACTSRESREAVPQAAGLALRSGRFSSSSEESPSTDRINELVSPTYLCWNLRAMKRVYLRVAGIFLEHSHKLALRKSVLRALTRSAYREQLRRTFARYFRNNGLRLCFVPGRFGSLRYIVKETEGGLVI